MLGPDLFLLLLCVCTVCGWAAPSKEDGINFLKQNREQPGVIQLPSGLQYKVLRAGTGTFHPTVTSPCDCHYAGTLIDGTEFDSSYARGQPTSFAPNQVIKGWTEAMQLMVEGDKWQMFIPPELAYGERGAGSAIPGGSTLIFTMELIKIKGAKVPAVQGSTTQPALETTVGADEQKPRLNEIHAAQLIKRYSWNVFRYIGDYLHLFGILVLFVTVGKNSAVTGFSKSTQILYCTIYCTRYLDLLERSPQASYLIFFKVTFIVSSILSLNMFAWLDSTYEAHKDTAPLMIIVIPCITAAFLLSDDYSITEMCWTLSQFLEGFAMVPQYVFCYRDPGSKDVGVSTYVIALGGYRVFYVLNWIYKKVNVPHYNDITSWLGGFIEGLFFLDFVMYRFTGSSMLRTLVLKLDEKVNLIQESVEMKVLGSSRRQVAAEGLRRRGGSKASDVPDTLDV